MTRRIVKAQLVGPHLSADVLQPCRVESPASLQLAEEVGVTVFLTAIDADAIAQLVKWYETRSEDENANLRLITPARFYWPGGSIRLPFETQTPDQAPQAAVNALSAVLEQEECRARRSPAILPTDT